MEMLTNAIKWLSQRIIGINYRTKLAMCYVCLGLGYHLILNGKPIGEFTALVAIILGAYATANVVEVTQARKLAATDKLNTDQIEAAEHMQSKD